MMCFLSYEKQPWIGALYGKRAWQNYCLADSDKVTKRRVPKSYEMGTRLNKQINKNETASYLLTTHSLTRYYLNEVTAVLWL